MVEKTEREREQVQVQVQMQVPKRVFVPVPLWISMLVPELEPVQVPQRQQ